MTKNKSDSSGCGALIFLIILTVLFVLFVKGCQFINDLFPGEEDEKEVRSTIVEEGRNGYIVQNTFVALDKESYDELIKYDIADNTDAIVRMMESGRVITGYKGEVVTVIDSSFTLSLIEIISTGQRGYVAREMVQTRIE